MAFLFHKFQEGFHKFQEAVKILAKSPTFARDPRHLQFEADVNRLFLCTSYNRLGRNADEKDVDEIIEMASEASVSDQLKQVQENIHLQIKNTCGSLDNILHLDSKSIPESSDSVEQMQNAPRHTGLSLDVGKSMASSHKPAVPETLPLSGMELSKRLKDKIGYTLEVKPSQISHEDAGQGLFLTGEADVGAIVAFYPGIIYSPAFYRHVPGYLRADTCNSYLITRYDGIVINAQPWGSGGETREVWDVSDHIEHILNSSEDAKISVKLRELLSKPLPNSPEINFAEVLERRNPLAFGHFANHPAKGMSPNVMVCPYDFPLTEKDMRVYVPNLVIGGEDSLKMKRSGTFWFRYGASRGHEAGIPVIKTLVLVATRALRDEEIFFNYRLNNSKGMPSWYSPVDQVEDL